MGMYLLAAIVRLLNKHHYLICMQSFRIKQTRVLPNHMLMIGSYQTTQQNSLEIKVPLNNQFIHDLLLSILSYGNYSTGTLRFKKQTKLVLLQASVWPYKQSQNTYESQVNLPGTSTAEIRGVSIQFVDYQGLKPSCNHIMLEFAIIPVT